MEIGRRWSSENTRQANAKVGAIIHAGQPSVTVLGVGDLIFGDAVRVAFWVDFHPFALVPSF